MKRKKQVMVPFGFMIPLEWKKQIEEIIEKHDSSKARFGRAAFKTALFGNLKKTK